MTVSFHFHGYQPGDIVRWVEEDPLKPPRFEARNSPVAIRIGDDRVAGRNWTDAVLRTYGRMGAVLERASGAAAVDVEPQTLAWLLGRDEAAYRRALAAWEGGIAGLALTPPFHPILPHHHRLERLALFDMMFDFFAPVLRRVEGPVGLWLPEAAYSAEVVDDYVAAARRAVVEHADLPDVVGAYLLADRRQIVAPGDGPWVRARGLAVIGRDHPLSGDFAFGASPAPGFVAAAGSRGDVHVSSDLESLLANPAQADRFASIVEGLRAAGHDVAAPSPPDDLPSSDLAESSSWSDYDEHLADGHTSDTRWTGIRRQDGLVVGRVDRGRRISQLWKHAFTLATEQIETAVRRTARDLLPGSNVERKREALRRLAVAYGRHVWRDHCRAAGYSAGDTDFSRAAEEILRGAMDVDVAAHLARSYVTMLMGLRSDPRFWDNPDTRVTFQNVACLVSSLRDAASACARAGRLDRAASLDDLFRSALLEFPEAYARRGFHELHGNEGWEVTEEAWFASIQSEVSHRSRYGVVRRSAYLTLGPAAQSFAGRPIDAGEVVADTGHIAGEVHGDWENTKWCEHRTAG